MLLKIRALHSEKIFFVYSLLSLQRIKNSNILFLYRKIFFSVKNLIEKASLRKII